jgi:hypothetical protein
MNEEIKKRIEQWASETEQALIDNLKRRKVVGQRLMIKKIKIELQTMGDQFAINFIFQREKQTVKEAYEINSRKKIFEISDPLFKTYKPWSRVTKEISFLRKANIFESLKGKYFDKIRDEVLAIDADFARKLVSRTFINES